MKSLKSSSKFIAYGSIFVLSFVFFIYFTFPYGILKETLVSTISEGTGIPIKVKRLRPGFPLGIQLEGLELVHPSADLALKDFEGSVGILSLFIGQLSVELAFYAESDGYLNVTSSFSLIDLVLGKPPVPTGVAFEANKFPIGPGLRLGLATGLPSSGADSLVSDFISKIKFEGDLNGRADFDLDTADFSASTGVLDINLTGASLKIAGLDVSAQNFEVAHIGASISSGRLILDKSSKFKSGDILIDLSGSIDLDKNIERSNLDIDIQVKLEEKLLKELDFFAGIMGLSSGSGRFQVKGPISRPTTITR